VKWIILIYRRIGCSSALLCILFYCAYLRICKALHIRRKYSQAQANDPERAQYALSQIQLLYEIERRCRQDKLSEEEIRKLKEKEAVPLLTHLGEWIETAYTEVLPKSGPGRGPGL
jgi:hypothetical protein